MGLTCWWSCVQGVHEWGYVRNGNRLERERKLVAQKMQVSGRLNKNCHSSHVDSCKILSRWVRKLNAFPRPSEMTNRFALPAPLLVWSPQNPRCPYRGTHNIEEQTVGRGGNRVGFRWLVGLDRDESARGVSEGVHYFFQWAHFINCPGFEPGQLRSGLAVKIGVLLWKLPFSPVSVSASGCRWPRDIVGPFGGGNMRICSKHYSLEYSLNENKPRRLPICKLRLYPYSLLS